MLEGLTKPLSAADKVAVERELRRVLAALAPDEKLSTREITSMVADNPLAINDHVRTLGLPPYNLATVGLPIPETNKKRLARNPDATRRPLIWRRIDSADMPVSAAIGRNEAGTFGPASSVRTPYATKEELDDLRAQVALLFELVSAMGDEK